MQLLQNTDFLEEERLERLGRYQISRTAPETAFNDIVELLAEQFDAPIAFLCTTEACCNWFKARVGLELEEVPRSISFCDHTLKGEGVMVVPDATLDSRFSASPMVTGPHHIRFYAGLTLRDPDGFAVGTLAVADVVPRQISAKQQSSLLKLGRMAMDRMELRKAQITLEAFAANAELVRQDAVSERAELLQVIECLPQSIVLMDTDDKILLWNNNYVRMFPNVADVIKPGIPYEAILRDAVRKGIHFHEAEMSTEEEFLEKWLSICSQTGVTTDLKFQDDRWIRCEQHRTPDGKKICVRSDITYEKNAADSFRLLFENNPVPMWVVDKSSHKYIDVNAAALEHYGYTRDAFLKMTLVDIRPQREHQRILDDAIFKFGTDNGKEDWIHLKADGTEIIVTTYANPIKYMDRDAALVAAIDVTERRTVEALIQHEAEHDPLTGLPNRRFFLELLDKAFATNAGNEYYTSIVLVDVDNLKGVNDTLGHFVGDKLIVAVGDRIKDVIGDRGIVARLGGDEFAILLPMLSDFKDAHLASQQLVSAFTKPVTLPGREYLVSVSAGLSYCINATLPASTLLTNADLALYKAKSDGRGICRAYEPQMSLQILMHSEVEQDLRHALAKDQLAVHFQPLIDLNSGAEVGFEALLRWHHPEKGAIPPASFIPIAESSGLIVPIGTWIMEQSCLLASTWREDMAVAVNISPVQFKAGILVETVIAALQKSGLPAHRLELEITESSLLEKTSETLDIVKKLKELGVKVVLDDFGTGYSGLGYLNSFPIDKIKIDRSFINDLGKKPKAVELVRAAINIGQSLGIITLAEGIETNAQLERLRALGCQQGQGFYFGGAMPGNVIADRIEGRNTVMAKRSVT